MEKLDVKWNDFSSMASRTFRNLYEDEAFEDVTLACEDGKQIRGHKSILSSSSPLFRLILVSNPHQHPVIYLKGIMLEELKSIKESIYLGTTEVWRDRLKSFMAAAKDLEIEGLAESANPEQNYSCDITDPIVKTEKKEAEIDGENCQISLVKTEREDDEDESKLTDMDNVSYDEQEYDLDASENNTINPNPDPLGEKAQAENQKNTSHAWQYPRQQFNYQGSPKILNMYGKSQGKKFSCNQCSKVYGSQLALSLHTKAEHEGVRYPCTVCPYQAKRKAHLKLHMEKRHFPAAIKESRS